VGVFANNGVHDSAPAILSWYCPPDETRTYAPGSDGPRILAIDHADPAKADAYADPALFARADWRDEFAYDADGRPAGWTRIRPGRTEDFAADGARILSRDPLRTEPVAYALRREGETLVVDELSAGAVPGYRPPAPGN
jgi:hypothetical protein